MPAKKVTLNAYAAEIVYTLTYDDEDWVYEDGQENPITYTVNTPTFTLYNPLSDERRSFNGWIINGEGNP
jgi:hypothetical protein